MARQASAASLIGTEEPAWQPAAPSTPSKTAEQENFPVGSWLLPPRLRSHIARYYAFARAADDIGDHPDLSPLDKIVALDRLEAVLAGADPVTDAERSAARLRASLAETRVDPRCASDLLIAFRQDAWKRRYRDWADLIGYCRNSANPVGRYLLALHGESDGTHAPSDALCTSLQILNHLQDLKDDYRQLDRVYLPLPWFTEHGLTPAALDSPRADTAMRRMIDRALDGVDDLNRTAARLPGLVHDRRMRMEAAVIVRVARRLAQRLRAGDPLAGRVALSRVDKLACVAGGIQRGW
ncbi:MAG: squalene synthase HpnC [Rhodospirillaceae bacterium]|nr:squalene synthase HpnC [Rhodospirillaceae bacterium]